MDTKYEYSKYLANKLSGENANALDVRTIDVDELGKILADFEWRIAAVESTCNRVEPE
jgi:uncharacterized protein YggE